MVALVAARRPPAAAQPVPDKDLPREATGVKSAVSARPVAVVLAVPLQGMDLAAGVREGDGLPLLLLVPLSRLRVILHVRRARREPVLLPKSGELVIFAGGSKNGNGVGFAMSPLPPERGR